MSIASDSIAYALLGMTKRLECFTACYSLFVSSL